jgi:hypothetical protein
MAPFFLDVGWKFRVCGRQLRESLVHMSEMCQRHGAYFLDLGKKTSSARETIKRICDEYPIRRAMDAGQLTNTRCGWRISLDGHRFGRVTTRAVTQAGQDADREDEAKHVTL